MTRLNLNNAKKLGAVIAVGLMALPFTALSAAPAPPASDKGYLPVEAAEPSPAEKELSGMFAPTFGHRDLKVSGGSGNRKLLTITSERPLNGRAVRKFNESLLSRGINIYGAAYYGDFAWDRTVIDAAITAIRQVPGEPDTIEISEGLARDPRNNQPLMPLTVAVNELSIPLKDEFGKTWHKVRVIPEADAVAPEPRTGRYPGSRVRTVRHNEPDKRDVVYAVRADMGEVERYFDDRLKEIHRTVIVSGDAAASPSPAEVFGIKTSAQVIVLSGYTYAAGTKKLAFTEVTLKRAADPSLAPYVEVQVVEN